MKSRSDREYERTDGRTLIPAFSMAMTKGDAAAVPLARFRSLLSYGTSSPMMVTPPM